MNRPFCFRQAIPLHRKLFVDRMTTHMKRLIFSLVLLGYMVFISGKAVFI